MDKIADYELVQKIAETGKSLVYRGRKSGSDETVVIKVLKAEQSTPSEVARFKQEYELIKSISLDGVIITRDLLPHNGSFAIVLEDFDGVSLKELLMTGKLPLRSFLKIAIKLSETLGSLHKQNIVHKDIKPHNILINTKQGKIKLTDFGISSILTHENEELYNSVVIEGTLPYMSPEQTGRMNRAVDYRTDLYSLGVTFYEILTGTVPFRSTDPLELIHSHIARKPVPPFEVNQSVPRPVSDIVMRLLEKTAEERYQNGFGLTADLAECLDRLKTKGEIDPFELGQKDISLKFHVPQKLVGRTAELDVLMSSFARVSKRSSEIIFVSGHPGIGKSALIQEIHKPIVAKKGYFISGKYDKFKRDVPYSAVIQAFQLLVRQVIAESAERIEVWKRQIATALGADGKIMTEVLPELELIIGKQPDMPDLGPEESQNRFNLVFKKFVGVFARQDHPLVLFLDDLQWADVTSLKLIKTLLTDSDLKCLLLIGAYRDNEVSESHILKLAENEMIAGGVVSQKIHLSPLDDENVNQLLSNFLKCAPETSAALAATIRSKTNGNPFFLNQFLKTLHEDNILDLDPVSGWKWDLDKIDQLKVTDNVLEIMVNKIARLPENTQEALMICSCIGNWFDLEMLAVIKETSVDEVLASLNDAIVEDLLRLDGNVYKFYHDRIQEAAYSLIPAADRARRHYEIGKYMLKITSKETLHEKIMYIVNQLNRGIDLLVETEEKYELARLNRMAATHARASAAYDAAAQHLSTALKILPADAWQHDHDLALSLFLESGESAYLIGEHEQAEKHFDIALANAKTPAEKVRINQSKMITYISSHKPQAALVLGIEALRILGTSMPKKGTVPGVLKGVITAKLNLGKRRVEDLIDLPELSDPHLLTVAKLLTISAEPSYIGVPEYYPIVVLKLLNLSLKHGNSVYSAFAYVNYGVILCGALGDIEGGFQFGKLSLQVLDKFNARALKTKVNFIFGGLINHWRRHIREDLPYFLDGYKSVSETGDLAFASYCVNFHNFHLFFAGENLEEMKANYDRYYDVMHKFQHLISFQSYLLWHQMILNLCGEAEDRLLIKGRVCDENEYVPLWREANEQTDLAVYAVARQILYYLYGAYEEALEAGREGERYLESVLGMVFTYEHCFYYSLALAARPGKSAAGLKQIRKNQKKLLKWAENCPENFLHKYLLVQAEIGRLTGKEQKDETGRRQAIDTLYDRAMETASKHGYVQDEAIAGEQAALFWKSRGRERLARFYMTTAHQRYRQWGAFGKVKDLEEKHADLIAEPARRKFGDTRGSTSTYTVGSSTLSSSLGRTTPSTMSSSLGQTTTSTLSSSLGQTAGSSTFGTSQALDLSTVLKASQAISGEIILDRLLERLLRIVMENAGARKGFLILDEDGRLLIEARGEIDQGQVTTLQSEPVDESIELSAAAIYYVERTKENLILNNAANEGMFTNDPYILNNKPKSVLCAPFINQGKLTGILYLENNLIAGAFTPDRLEVLNMLCSQAAVSIENARLYTNLETLNNDLERKVIERTRDLEIAKNRAERSHFEIEKLNEFSKKINANVNLDEILDLIMDYMRTNFKIGDAWLQLVDKEKNELSTHRLFLPERLLEENKKFFNDLRIPLNPESGNSWQAYSTKRPIYASKVDESQLSGIDRKINDKLGIKSILQMPLVVQNETIAVFNFLSLDERMKLARSDISSISRFCEQIAGAINSTSLLKAVQAEREKSDKLLLNILPAKVARELKEKGEVEPLLYESITIIFTDFKGFTAAAETMLPDELVRELNTIFLQFDNICDIHKIEKLKTIGDAYMCAGGLPEINYTHPVDACLAALEIEDFIAFIQETRGRKKDFQYNWNLRLGINTGTAMAGVIGKNKFAYDVWGDAVNTASRMESYGAVGRANISDSTYRLVKDFFVCEYRGKEDVKNKGLMDMYFLDRIKPELSSDSEGRVPNDEFKRMYENLKPR